MSEPAKLPPQSAGPSKKPAQQPQAPLPKPRRPSPQNPVLARVVGIEALGEYVKLKIAGGSVQGITDLMQVRYPKASTPSFLIAGVTGGVECWATSIEAEKVSDVRQRLQEAKPAMHVEIIGRP